MRIALNANHANGGTITMADVSTGTNAATVQSVSGAVTLSARTNVALGVVSTGGTVGGDGDDGQHHGQHREARRSPTSPART